MSTFVLLTMLPPTEVHGPDDFDQLERRVMSAVRSECHGVDWIQSYALSGPWTYLDLFHAPDVETATKVSLLFQTLAKARTELWPAMEWRRFQRLTHELPQPNDVYPNGERPD